MNNNQANFVNPGPLDETVLYLQKLHRSTNIWYGHDDIVLSCKRPTFLKEDDIDHRVVPYLISTGFYGIYTIGMIVNDRPLITALVERWRKETHTFHFRNGEATITLQDVEVILGLPVEGHAVINTGPRENWLVLCQELLGVTPSIGDIKGSFLHMGWLTDNFRILDDDATEDQVKCYARAIILGFIGGILLPDKSGNMINLQYLSFLRDIDDIKNYSWGSATLGYLYRQLCSATDYKTSQITGCLMLLQIWAWERIICVRPNIDQMPMLSPPGPVGYRWRAIKDLRNLSIRVLRVYRDQLDNMNDEVFVWQPYELDDLPDYCKQGQQSWMSKVPLICIEKVELHFPDRVLRQFGMLQGIPLPCDTSIYLHKCGLRGKSDQIIWLEEHRTYVDLWQNRHQLVISGANSDGAMTRDDPYMIWYYNITRVLIGGESRLLYSKVAPLY